MHPAHHSGIGLLLIGVLFLKLFNLDLVGIRFYEVSLQFTLQLIHVVHLRHRFIMLVQHFFLQLFELSFLGK